MKVLIKKKYYKRSVKGRNPIHFHAEQPYGVGTDIHAELHIDPILKKHRDLRKAMILHEKNELSRWGKGHRDAHNHAKCKEPKLTKKINGVGGFWQEIERREHKKRK